MGPHPRRRLICEIYGVYEDFDGPAYQAPNRKKSTTYTTADSRRLQASDDPPDPSQAAWRSAQKYRVSTARVSHARRNSEADESRRASDGRPRSLAERPRPGADMDDVSPRPAQH